MAPKDGVGGFRKISITLSLSLRTSDLRIARARGAAMTVMSERLRMTIQQKIARSEIGGADARQIMSEEMRRYCRTLARIDASMIGDPEQLSVGPDRSLVVFEQLWSGAERGGLIAHPDEFYADTYWPNLSKNEKQELRNVLQRCPPHLDLKRKAIAWLHDARIEASPGNIDIAVRLMVRARAQASKLAVDDPLAFFLGGTDEAVPPSVLPATPSSASQSAGAPLRDDLILEESPVSVDEALAPLRAQTDPFYGVKGDARAILEMTPVELAEAFIARNYGFLDHRRGGKRAPLFGKTETRRQILCAARLLQQSVPAGTPFSLVTSEQVKTFDSYLDGLPLSFGKALADHSRDVRLVDIVESTATQIAEGRTNLTLEQVGLSIPTSNKHFRYLQRLRDFVEELCPALPPLSFRKYCQPDLKSDRDARAEYTVEQGEAIFSLPPWVGCSGLEKRLASGTEIIHDALYWVLLLVWYTGARREEICSLKLVDIKEDLGFQYIQIGEGKTINAIRRIPIANELKRLGFVQFVEAMRNEGETRLFPEIEPGRENGKLGDVYYKLWWIYLRPLVPGLIRGQAMHSCRHTVSTELKDLEVFPEFRNDLLGHAGGGREGESRYAKAARLQKLQTLVDSIPIVTKHLPSLQLSAINLLPQALRVPRPTRSVLANN